MNAGKLFIIVGAILILTGVLAMLSQKIPLLGRMPGDIVIRRDNFTFYFPLATSIIISIILSLIISFILRQK